ncbi:MAG TPA: hypothetical protein VK088_08835 [Acidimicrobiia bacterium]|nr:hypothetical protein [Acidimicrobiia bacterium]
MIIYLVAWTGGYEQPAFAFHADESLARETFEDWQSQVQVEVGDRVDLIRHDTSTGSVETIEVA